MRPILDALIVELADGAEHNRSQVVAAVRQATSCNPSTLTNIVANLARFGIIDRPSKRLRLTALGWHWLVDHGHLEAGADSGGITA